MNIDREQLLKELEAVTPGLSPREIVEQSSCFVFIDNKVATYNDEVTCSQDCCLGITGAVQAKPLLEILRRLKDTTVDMSVEKQQLRIRLKKGRGGGIPIESEISLPIESVKRPKKWQKLSDEFAEAISMVESCVGKDQTQFHLTCIHLHPEHIEACDNFRAARFKIQTGLNKSILVRRDALKFVTSLGMNEFGLTKSWIHFKNGNGLLFSCRLYVEEYPDLTEILKVKGTKTKLPKGLETAVDRASVFSRMDAEEDHVLFEIVPGKVRVKSKSVSGWWTDPHKINYDKKPMKFTVSPTLMREILQKYNEVVLGEERLKVGLGKFTYVTVLGSPEVKEEKTESKDENSNE